MLGATFNSQIINKKHKNAKKKKGKVALNTWQKGHLLTVYSETRRQSGPVPPRMGTGASGDSGVVALCASVNHEEGTVLIWGLWRNFSQ